MILCQAYPLNRYYIQPEERGETGLYRDSSRENRESQAVLRTGLYKFQYFRVASSLENAYSSRPLRRGCISNGDEKDKRDPLDLRTFCQT